MKKLAFSIFLFVCLSKQNKPLKPKAMKKETILRARAEKQQTVKLDTLSNMAYIIAKGQLKHKGVYFCILDGIKTEVIY